MRRETKTRMPKTGKAMEAGRDDRTSAGNAAAEAVRAVDLVKVYGKTNKTQVRALAGLSAGFEAGRFTAIMGPSGSGKSTLLHCLAGLDKPTSGRVYMGETELTALDEKRLTTLRRDKVGFVFQAFNLVPTLTALENIHLPMSLAGRKPDSVWVDTVIDAVGLRPRLDHRPSELSGGEQQRVAAARALAGKPEVVFADEPTGNLNSRAGAELLEFMQHAVRDFGQTIVMVTHDPVAASFTDHVVFLGDGLAIDEMPSPSRKRVLDRLKLLEV